jgi:hypothetical protein
MARNQKHNSGTERKGNSERGVVSPTWEARDDWMRDVLASDEPCGARRLAVAIALHLNIKTGQCNPGHETLAKESRLSLRSVERYVVRLERGGWLGVKRGGWGRTNSYVLRRPATTVADQQPADPPFRDFLIRHSVRTDPPHGGGQNNGTAKNRTAGTVLKDRSPPGRESALRAEEITPCPGTPAADAATPDDLGKAAVTWRESEERSPREDFASLRAIWQRGHLKDDKPKEIAFQLDAYKRARRIASHAEIMAGAERAIAAADAPRFLDPLADWLDAKSWTKPPKQKRQRGNGNGRQRSNGHAKPNMAAIYLEEGGYRRDADGNLYWPGGAS